MLPDLANSEEIAPFRITGVDGEVYLRYFSDEYRSRNEGSSTSWREGTTTEEGLDFTIHSYIYHPNFFRLDFGGGPVFVQHEFDSDTEDNSDQDEYLNFHAKAHILERKPYPLILYYDRYSSTTPYAVQDRVLLTRENYGLNFRLKRPVIPALVTFDLNRTKTDGRSDQRITDEITDRASVKVSSDLGPNGDGRISYTRTRTQSASGSTSIEITETSRKTDLIDAWTNHLFGDREQVRFINSMTYKEQDNLPELDEFRYSPRLFVTHSDDLKSTYRYSYLNRTVGQNNTISHAIDSTLNHQSFQDRLDTTVDLHADRFDTEGLQQDYYRGGIDLSYLQPYDGFRIRYSGGWSYDYTDRVGDDVSVIAETHAVSSTTLFALDNTNVIESTIVVRNISGTQTFIEGIHYELIAVGDETKIRWIDLNDIPVEVDVDYFYESGGNASFTSFRQRYRVDLTRGQYLKLFAKYRSINRNLESGDPTIPLNSSETATAGINVDYPLRNNMTLGGKAEHETHDADIGSYRKNSAGAYVQFSKVLKGNVRIFGDRVLVDNLESQEDLDLTRYGLRYRSRPWHRTTLSAGYAEETDTGGTRDRANTRASVRLSWAYRQLDLSAEARYDKNELDETERTRRSINLLLTRSF